jgi:hypothetical protein
MDFGSIVGSLSGADPFNWATGPLSSSYAHNCGGKNHYHRHCSCALHSIDSGFKGSPTCTPSNTVKVNKDSSRRMCRSMSVQNFGDKKFQSGHSNSGDDDAFSRPPSPARKLGNFTSSFSSLAQLEMEQDDELSPETVSLVEELASFIKLIKHEDPADSNIEVDDDETMSLCSERSASPAMSLYSERSPSPAMSLYSERSASPAMSLDSERSASPTMSLYSERSASPAFSVSSERSVSSSVQEECPSTFRSRPILVPSLYPKPPGSSNSAKFAPDHARSLRLSLLERTLSTQFAQLEYCLAMQR